MPERLREEATPSLRELSQEGNLQARRDSTSQDRDRPDHDRETRDRAELRQPRVIMSRMPCGKARSAWR